MGGYQNGFGDGKSVIDNIFALKVINEKLWEYNQSVQYLFIDFQKAYDSTSRLRTQQTHSMTYFCKSSFCFTGKQTYGTK
jgi:hypothetical protein